MTHELMAHVVTGDGWVYEETCWVVGLSVACKPSAGYVRLYDGDPNAAGVDQGAYGLTAKGQELFVLPGELFHGQGVYMTFHGDAEEAIVYCSHSAA